MSQDEIRQQKAMLMLEHAEAKERLAVLRGKATRIGAEFQKFGSLMESEPQRIVSPSSKFTVTDLELIEIRPDQVELLQLEKAVTVTDELRTVLRRMSDLEHRMREFGMRIDG